MTFTKRFIAILLSFALAFTALSSTAFASNGIASKGKRIPYSELPEGYKSVISSDAIIYQQRFYKLNSGSAWLSATEYWM